MPATAQPTFLSTGNPFDVPVHFDLPDDRAVQAAPVQGFGSLQAPVSFPAVIGPDRQLGKVLVSGHTLDTGSSATYGDAARAAAGRGYVIPVSATTQRLTLGAGLVANHASRFSGLYGRTADAVESFELATPDGKRRLIRRPDQTTSEENDALFRAVPGGFGYLGAVGRIRTQLMRLPASAAWTTPRVETTTATTTRFETLVDELVHDHLLANDSVLPPLSRPFADGVGSWAMTSQDGHGVLFRSQYVPGDRPLKPFFLHQPEGTAHRLGRLATFSQLLSQLGWRLAWEVISRRTQSYVDSLSGFTFQQDGSWRARENLKRVGASAWQARQSFVLPLRRNDLEPGKRPKQFLEQSRQLLALAGVRVNPIELVTLPADHYLLSASRGMEGMQLTFSSQGLSEVNAQRFSQLMRRLSRTCADLGGRVQLEKGVAVEPHVLQQMYGDALSRLRDLKAEYDPDGMVENPFVERLLKR